MSQACIHIGGVGDSQLSSTEADIRRRCNPSCFPINLSKTTSRKHQQKHGHCRRQLGSRRSAMGIGWKGWSRHGNHPVHLFREVGVFDEHPVAVEITYGLERIAMYIQERTTSMIWEWTDGVTYGETYGMKRI